MQLSEPSPEEVLNFKYNFRPYRPEFAFWAGTEKQRLLAILPANVEVHHFGSTAVPGLSGKGIIDLMLIVPSEDPTMLVQEPTSLITVLESHGYHYRPHVRLDSRRWFLDRFEYLETGEIRGFHIHIVNEIAGRVPIEILFRDYLCHHPQQRNQYEAAKQKAVAAAQLVFGKEAKKQAYIQAKEPIIQSILSKIAQEQKQ